MARQVCQKTVPHSSQVGQQADEPGLGGQVEVVVVGVAQRDTAS